jgi:hypothetical protein
MTNGLSSGHWRSREIKDLAAGACQLRASVRGLRGSEAKAPATRSQALRPAILELPYPREGGMIDLERNRDRLSAIPWERHRMTVGIAAICRHAGNAAIVACTDWKVSNSLGSSETRYKLSNIGSWHLLSAGADDEIARLRLHLDNVFRSGNVDETTIIPLCNEAVRRRKHEKADGYISAKFGITYDQFLEKGKLLFPSEVFREIMLDVSSINLRAEMLIFGIENGLPYICEIATDSSVHIREDYAAIGEGRSLSFAALLRRDQSDYTALHKTMYNIYESKKYAEKVPSVGDLTNIAVLFQDNSMELVSLGYGYDMLNLLYDTYGPKEIGESAVHFDEDKLFEKFDD